ncbi:02967048-f0dd-4f5e-828b-ca6bacc772ce [Sclerotinia trifoliorum]|uniref:02967048-f0dd-4f5e-828b-ca6bacc772ce n=1 Tax=Sclerotinia trifoliorum TaxID=28548 RepID=A0A8H2ZPI1_9HELO|nr:02967048-f0dd-4f5e-828b-ca6bacc772ce [Sclerotinia trifoliorum]
MTKLIIIMGVTGNQGHSVAQKFLQDPNYKVRGLTRNPSSATSQSLSAQGVEIIKADLDDVTSLISAFQGANLIFSVTNYWEPFFRPDSRQQAQERGISCRKYAYQVEYQQGKNIADAAAHPSVISGLDANGFVASTLSHAGKSSGGKFTEVYHHDAKADVFPYYVRERYGEEGGLAGKMSCVMTGYFTSSYKLAMKSYLGKRLDGSFQMSFPTNPDKAVPHLSVNSDLGSFIYAVSQLSPGRSYMACGSNCSWSEYIRLWSEITGKPARYKQCTEEDFVGREEDRDFGEELYAMFAYSSDPGYDGGDKSLWMREDIEKVC